MRYLYITFLTDPGSVLQFKTEYMRWRFGFEKYNLVLLKFSIVPKHLDHELWLPLRFSIKWICNITDHQGIWTHIYTSRTRTEYRGTNYPIPSVNIKQTMVIKHLPKRHKLHSSTIRPATYLLFLSTRVLYLFIYYLIRTIVKHKCYLIAYLHLNHRTHRSTVLRRPKKTLLTVSWASPNKKC